MDITNIIIANLNDHNNLGYSDRPVTEAAPELMTKPDETLFTCTLPAVIVLWLRSTRISSLFESVAHLEIFPCSPENVTCSPENFTCSPENFTFSPQNCTSSPVKCRYLPE